MRALIAGYGNPLRGDDGAGWHVARALEERWDGASTPQAEVRVLSGHQPLPEWAALVADADVVVFVDACQVESGASEAPVHLRRLDAPVPVSTLQPDAFPNGHALGAAALLALAQALYGQAPTAYLVALPAQHFGYTDRLSALTAAAVDRAVILLDEWLTGSQWHRSSGVASRRTAEDERKETADRNGEEPQMHANARR
jgi:hydrogenase maturation protease